MVVVVVVLDGDCAGAGLVDVVVVLVGGSCESGDMVVVVNRNNGGLNTDSYNTFPFLQTLISRICNLGFLVSKLCFGFLLILVVNCLVLCFLLGVGKDFYRFCL
ncbi:hypothetical protein Hdeb2414_s0001g00019031 [Helianthus debilis subsp. tardiflorus]